MPWLHLVLILAKALEQGMATQACVWLVSFTAYLGPSEAITIRLGYILAPPSTCPAHSVILQLVEGWQRNKTGLHHGGVQFDSPSIPWLSPPLHGSRLRHVGVSQNLASLT